MSEQVNTERAEQAAAAASLLDTKDETVRGCIPVVNLTRRAQRQDALKRVTSWATACLTVIFAMAKIRRFGHDHKAPFFLGVGLVLGRIKRGTKPVVPKTIQRNYLHINALV
jgi:hypothetical protein